MTAKVLDSFGGKFAEQWVATLLTPAFGFWLGGLVAITQRYGWPQITAAFTRYPEPLQIALLVGWFCVVAASAFVVQRFDLTTLRFLEGYWPRWLRSLHQRRVAAYRKRQKTLIQQIQDLRALEDQQKKERQILKTRIEQDGANTLSPDEREQYLQLRTQLLTSDQQETLVRLEQELRTMPRDAEIMPTQLGNLLRSAERKPLVKYGLDAVICWPRLWLLLPDAAKKDLQEARADLNAAARGWLWSLLFTLWVFSGAWWAVPLGLLSAWFSYSVWVLNAARTYCDLIEAAFDLYRILLYQSLRWPLPANPQQEHQLGQALTQYLWQISESDWPTFTNPKPN